MTRQLACLTLTALLLPLVPSAGADTLKVPQDHPTIGAALAAAADDDTVVVSKGVYRERIDAKINGLTLIGKNAVIDGEYLGHTLALQGDDITVKGFTVINGLGDGIHIEGARAVVTKCSAFHCDDDGIDVAGPAATITSNTSSGHGDKGIHWTQEVTAAAPALIAKNLCTHNGDKGIETEGDHYEVAKNRCYVNDDDGLHIRVEEPEGGASPDAAVLVTANTCQDNDSDGIECKRLSGLVVPLLTKNRLETNGSDGLELGGTAGTASANRIAMNVGHGIEVHGPFMTVTGNTLTANRRTSINVEDDGDPIEHVTIEDNVIRNGFSDGVRVRAGTHVIVRGNQITGCLSDGIDIQSTDVEGAVIEDNVCLKNMHEGIDNRGTNTVIVDNVCKQNGHGLGPDIAGSGDYGEGTCAEFSGNVFGSGGEEVPSRADHGENTEP